MTLQACNLAAVRGNQTLFSNIYLEIAAGEARGSQAAMAVEKQHCCGCCADYHFRQRDRLTGMAIRFFRSVRIIAAI